jgi:hypothetical protein
MRADILRPPSPAREHIVTFAGPEPIAAANERIFISSSGDARGAA